MAVREEVALPMARPPPFFLERLYVSVAGESGSARFVLQALRRILAHVLADGHKVRGVALVRGIDAGAEVPMLGGDALGPLLGIFFPVVGCDYDEMGAF